MTTSRGGGVSGRARRRRPAVGASSWDTFSPIRPFQPFWVGLGLVFLLPGLVLTYLRLVPPSEDGPALVASFISYAVVTYLLALGCFAVALVRGRRQAVLGLLAGLTAALMTCHLAWLAPLFRADDRRAIGASFTVMSLNLLHGGADPGAVSRQAADVDVVVLLEATPAIVAALARYGWDERFPHSVGRPEAGASGTLLYSRFPVSESQSLSTSQFQQWISTVTVPQIGAVRVIAAHPCNPYCGSGRWDREHRQLSAVAAANGDRPLVVVGDLNAVEDHRPMIALRRSGLRSAADIVGAGWQPTYPASRVIPPLLPIDHVLVNRFLTTTSLTRFLAEGTDHLGLLVGIAAAR